MTIRTRAAKAEDYEGLLAIYSEVDELHRTHHPELFRRPDGAARARAYIEAYLQSGDRALFVAECGEMLIGFAECYIQKSTSFPLLREREWVQLDTIAVLKSHQQHQAGSLLLETVLGWAKERGIGRVELKVYDFNDSAREFYQSRGFRPLLHAMYLDL